MMLSMTGFARAVATNAEVTVAVELRAVNSRSLDLALKLPADLRHLEEHLRTRIAGHLTRGRIEADVKVDDPGARGQVFEIDPARAEGLATILGRLREAGIDVRIGLNDLTGATGVLTARAAPQSDPAIVLGALDQALDQALAGLVAMRRTEGNTIAADMRGRLAWMAGQIDRIAALAEGLPALFNQRLAERLAGLTAATIDAQRLAQEAALLADRCDITEEIVRARSHLAQFAAIMAADEPAGRKLNFLVQELNREFNTIGSKANQADIAHLTVDLKSELEKIREQVQNIE